MGGSLIGIVLKYADSELSYTGGLGYLLLYTTAEVVGLPATGEDDKSSHYIYSLYSLHILK